MATVRLTMAQALVRFLKVQAVERDGKAQPFFAGMWGIFGHGNVAGIGQALEEYKDLRYFQARNEQGMVHAAVAFAKQQRRLQAFACTSSVGPGATNMLTAAAGASINRLPVLLLPGDVFARRTAGPVLQQLEHPLSAEASVNDCFRPISRFWDRINRPEQLLYSLPAALRVLTDPVHTGAVTLALPQDVQAEAYDWPSDFFAPRTYHIDRPRPDTSQAQQAVALIRAARCPLVVVGGGVLYAEAEAALQRFCDLSGAGVAETQAGKGALAWHHPQHLGALGATGTLAANTVAREADLVIAVGTRLSDFTTASATLFNNPQVKFLGINIASADAGKFEALALVGDARACLEELNAQLLDEGCIDSQRLSVWHDLRVAWQHERARVVEQRSAGAISQGEVVGLVNAALAPEDTVVGAAGGLPGDMHKLFNVERSGQYHMEYGFSCMGYEIAGGLGVKMAKKQGEVFVMVGDGSYLMLHTEIVTSVQEHQKLIIVLLDNHKFACIDRLARACGSQGFGNEFRYRADDGTLTGEVVAVDYAASAAALGAHVIKADGYGSLQQALVQAREADRTCVIVVEVDGQVSVPSYQAKWEVVVAETSSMASVQCARRTYEEAFGRKGT